MSLRTEKRWSGVAASPSVYWDSVTIKCAVPLMSVRMTTPFDTCRRSSHVSFVPSRKITYGSGRIQPSIATRFTLTVVSATRNSPVASSITSTAE